MALTLTWRAIKVMPVEWKSAGASRPMTPFTAGYSATVMLLDRELEFLGATEAFLQVETKESEIRRDGQMRANAKVTHPGVILTVMTRQYGTLVYPCDRFGGYASQPGWQANLRAIALGMEALRKVERYGIAERGQQYAGFREIGAGLTVLQQERLDAALFIGQYSGANEAAVKAMLTSPDLVLEGVRLAVKELHPDNGGDPALFRRLMEARDDLLAEPG